MTTRPRPTVAERNALERQIAHLEAALETERANVRTAEAERHEVELEAKRARLTAAELDPEAQALAGCVAAIDAMRQRQRDRLGGNYVMAATPHALPLGAEDTDVGRVLLHLAHRYGVPLATRPAPAPDPIRAQVLELLEQVRAEVRR